MAEPGDAPGLKPGGERSPCGCKSHPVQFSTSWWRKSKRVRLKPGWGHPRVSANLTQPTLFRAIPICPVGQRVRHPSCKRETPGASPGWGSLLSSSCSAERQRACLGSTRSRVRGPPARPFFFNSWPRISTTCRVIDSAKPGTSSGPAAPFHSPQAEAALHSPGTGATAGASPAGGSPAP